MTASIIDSGIRPLKTVGILVFLLLLTQVCFAQASHLEFSILLEKSEYKKQEPIMANFKLENKGEEPIWVNKRFYLNSESVAEDHRGEVVLKVTSPSGQEIPCKFAYEAGLPKSDYFEILAPGKSAVSEYPRNLCGYFDLNEPGVYNIVAVYQNISGKEIGLDVFGEKLTAEPVSLKVIE